MISYCKLMILNILKRVYYYYLLGTIYNMLNYVPAYVSTILIIHISHSRIIYDIRQK